MTPHPDDYRGRVRETSSDHRGRAREKSSAHRERHREKSDERRGWLRETSAERRKRLHATYNTFESGHYKDGRQTEYVNGYVKHHGRKSRYAARRSYFLRPSHSSNAEYRFIVLDRRSGASIPNHMLEVFIERSQCQVPTLIDQAKSVRDTLLGFLETCTFRRVVRTTNRRTMNRRVI